MATKRIIAEQIKRIISTGSSRFDDNIDLRELMALVDNERDRLVKEEIIVRRNSGDFGINGQYLTSEIIDVVLMDYLTPFPYFISTKSINSTISLPNDLEIYSIKYKAFGSGFQGMDPSLNEPAQNPLATYGLDWEVQGPGWNVRVDISPIRKPANGGVLYDDPSIHNFLQTGPVSPSANEQSVVTSNSAWLNISEGYDWTNVMNKPTSSYIRNHFWELTPSKKIKITNLSQPHVYNAGTSSDVPMMSTLQNQMVGTIGTLTRARGNTMSPFMGMDWIALGNNPSVTNAETEDGGLSVTGNMAVSYVSQSSTIHPDGKYPVPADMITKIVDSVSKMYMQAGSVYPQKYE